MKYREFVAILEKHGFQEDRVKGSHHQFIGSVNKVTRLVTVDYSQLGEDITRKNLASMIRQSGLPKRTFRG